MSIFSFGEIDGQVKTLRLKPFKIQTLSDTLKETSGLTLVDDRLFSFNDSGNSSEIFEIKKGTSNIKNVFKTQLINIDWEAITYSENHFYIGDFGNNLGTRKDLSIYKIPFKNDNLVLDSIQRFYFSYEAQIDFTSRNIKHDFDAEAMIMHNGQINVFSKEWKSKKISRYIIDINNTNLQILKPLENYDIGYSVTDATYHKGKLYTVGYNKKTEVFLTIFYENNEGLFFKQPAKKYFLGSATFIGQIEGIVANDEGLYISGEFFNFKIGKVKQSLFYLPYDKIE